MPWEQKSIKIKDTIKYSDISVLSFHPVKAITTGERALITNNLNILNYQKN